MSQFRFIRNRLMLAAWVLSAVFGFVLPGRAAMPALSFDAVHDFSLASNPNGAVPRWHPL
jgi:hypothetical protein